MGRLFLSGQTTCALLLGAGLLLRAQAALQKEPEPAAQQAVETPGEKPPAMLEQHALRARMARPGVSTKALRLDGQAVNEQGRSHVRKGVAHRAGRSKAKRYGSALAQKLVLKRG
jgi:hypothetical protein